MVIIQLTLIVLILFFSIYDSGSVPVNENTGKSIGFIVITAGVVLMILAIISFRQAMTPNPVPMENYALKTTGFYKYIRHPVYSFALLTLSGVVLYYRSISGVLFLMAAICFISVKIVFEEAQLKRKFPEYETYSVKTKKLIPYIY